MAKKPVPPGTPRYNPDLGRIMHKVGTAKDGLPIYSDALDVLVEVLASRIKDQRQNVIAVIGSTGSGKSTVAIQICFKLDPYFSFAKDYIYSAEDLVDKLDLPKGAASPVSLFDEGSIILNSLNFARRGDKDIVVLFDTMRSRGWTTVICTPELRNLNNRVRDDHVNYLIECGGKPPLPGFRRRGFFKIYRKAKLSSFQTKPFWKPICYGISQKLAPRIDKEYQQYKKASQDRLINELIENQRDRK